MNILCVIRFLCSFITSSQSQVPCNIHLLALLLIQTSLKQVMLFLIIAMMISKLGIFRNKRCPQDGNFKGCVLLTISFKLAEVKCIVSCISPI